MRFAVLGAGSAGHMAVAHVGRYFPNASITHFYDPDSAPIGVGEGTTPVFTEWATRVLGWTFADLERLCDATPKVGIVFEGWGPKGTDYTHLFGSSEGVACHLSAARLGEHLAARSSAKVIAQPVRSMSVRDGVAIVSLQSGDLEFDFVFDARGFPTALDDESVALSCVPTDAAILTRGPRRLPRDRTRAVARPHGWIFAIPLGSDTAYGYVHGHQEAGEAGADFEQFLDREGIEPNQPLRSLRFPNFRRVAGFDGVVFAIGNRAGFIEPLEATALGLIVLQLQVATFWLLDRALGQRDVSVDAVNRALAETIDETGSFVGWHYARGSPYSTPFWNRAVSQFEPWLRTRGEAHRSRFNSYVRRGLELPRELAFADSVADVDRLVNGCDTRLDTFGGFLDVSFAKVGHGIGWA